MKAWHLLVVAGVAYAAYRFRYTLGLASAKQDTASVAAGGGVCSGLAGVMNPLCYKPLRSFDWEACRQTYADDTAKADYYCGVW